MRTYGELPLDELITTLHEFGYVEEAEAIQPAVRNALPRRRFDISKLFERNIPAWLHTGHTFGFVSPALPGKKLLRITHAGNMTASSILKNRRITVRLDSIRVADYPGKGTHHVLFDFRAQNHVEKMIENVRFNQAFRIREGQDVGVIGYPVFVGLNVGEEGVSFECSTLNAKNQEEEALIEFLDSEIFKNGLRLATVAQPAIAPLTAMATNITKMLAAGNREIAVQNFRMGLDFSNGPGGARLAEGLYIAVQIPQEKTVLWKWKEWVYDQANGHIVHKEDRDRLIPYNYVSFTVTKFEDATKPLYFTGTNSNH